MSLEELEMYATKYFIYECNRLSLNQNKINFNLDQLPDYVAGLTEGANFTIAPNTTEKQNMALLDVINIQPYTIILETQPTITIDVIKLAKNDIIIRFIAHAIKHELIHACEAHGSKAGLLSSIIMYYYGENELKSDHCKELLKYYNKALELQANIIPALLEKNYHNTLADIKPINYKSGTDIHPDGDVIHFWLEKIEIAKINKPRKNTTQKFTWLKKLYGLWTFLKNISF